MARKDFSGFLVSAIIGAMLLTYLPGCSGGDDAKSMIAAANDSNVKRLATLYNFFHLKNRFKGPKDESEFRDFITAQDPERLKLADIEVSNLDELFVSERDGQAFVIRYGVDTVIRGPSLPVVFESEGVDGMRQVGFCNGEMQEVNGEQYDRLLKGKADQARVEDGRQ